MINCNPETVSTDYDTSDRLYFEPLTAEDVLEIVRVEQSKGTLHGVIVQFGGQTPLKLAHALQEANVPILGTSPDAIDLAEDRDRFQKLIVKLGLKQPKNGIAYSVEQARLVVAELGFPLVVRPSYVLGGRAMQIIREDAQLGDYLLGTLPELVPDDVKIRYPNDKTGQINTLLGKNPLLFDRYLSDAIEVDVDALADGKDVFICGIMEHIEEAGIHSGDSACSLPPHSLSPETIAELERQTRALALGLEVRGLMNVQYAIKDGDIYVLEVNPRASRTVPFVAKTVGQPFAKIGALVMAGTPLADFDLKPSDIRHVGGQGSGLPLRPLPECRHPARPRNALDRRGDGPRPRLCRRLRQEPAWRRRHRSDQRHRLRFRPRRDKPRHRRRDETLKSLGFDIVATSGTQRFLEAEGVPCAKINKVLEGRPHIVDAIKNGEVQLVINTTEGAQALTDSRSLRRAALLHRVPVLYDDRRCGRRVAGDRGIQARQS